MRTDRHDLENSRVSDVLIGEFMKAERVKIEISFDTRSGEREFIDIRGFLFEGRDSLRNELLSVMCAVMKERNRMRRKCLTNQAIEIQEQIEKLDYEFVGLGGEVNA